MFLTKNVSLVTKSLPGDNLEITEKVIPLYTNKNYNKNYPSGLSVSYINHETSKFNRDNIIFIHGEKDDCTSWGLFGCKKTLDRGNFNINGGGKTLNLSGTYFINGNFIVNNTHLRSDAMLYVNGNVDIKDSTLNGINSNSTLFIFATGDISISNISVDSATPSMIKGFFYSKQNMIMYGVGSNMNLYGGISAKRTILTAVRGNSHNYTYESSKNQKETVMTNGVEVPKRNSRLKITYDENLISQYTSFKRDEEEEFITELNEPEIMNRY